MITAHALHPDSSSRPRSHVLRTTVCVGALLLLGPAPSFAQQCTSKTYGSASLFKAGQKLVDGDADIALPRVAANGSIKVFHSNATNYEGDSPGVFDVFYTPNYSARAQRVSVGTGGAPADGSSFQADASGDGKWIAFTSNAANLVAGDTNGHADVFLFEVATAAIQRINLGVGGAEANAPSSRPAVSGNGRYIVFQSQASNLVTGDSNAAIDVFRYDQVNDLLVRVSVDSGGGQGNGDSSEAAIDGSGDLIAFQSLATNLAPGTDANGVADVFLHKVSTGNTLRLSEKPGGGDANGPSVDPELSANGKFVSYTSSASNLLAGGADSNGKDDIFLENLVSSTRLRVSIGQGDAQANDDSSNSSVSDIGSVAFQSNATNLVGGLDQNGVTDVFVRVPSASLTYRASTDSDGVEADGPSFTPDLTASGCDVVFASPAKNLIALRPLEGNTVVDAFCHRHEGPWPILCIEPELQDINQSLQIRSTSGPPLGKIVLFVTHVNDTLFVKFLWIASFDSNGDWVLNTSVPNDPLLLGLVPTMIGFVFPAGGGPGAATNFHFLGIQN